MNKLDLSLHYLNAVDFSGYKKEIKPNEQQKISLIQELYNLGYLPTENFIAELNHMDIELLFNDLIPTLQKLVGDNVIHKPMYPNFPKQIHELSDFELYQNAIIHYWTNGKFTPEYEIKLRKLSLEPNIKLKKLDVCVGFEIWNKINNVALSSDSITSFDKEAIQFSLSNKYFNLDPLNLKKITFAETRCIVLSDLLKNENIGLFIESINNMTDILRVVTYISLGDISLRKSTIFKKFKRSDRRFLITAIESCWDDETAKRHKNKWVKLLHTLHVGDYSKIVWNHAQKLRENIRIETFNSDIESRLKVSDIKGAIEKLKQRPSEFARRLDHLIRISDSEIYVIEQFGTIMNHVPNKILIQLYGHFEHRTTKRKSVVIPKGTVSKAVLIDQQGEISSLAIQSIKNIIKNTLMIDFFKKSKLGKVYIDERLKNCPVPSGMRSISDGLITVPRGTSFDIGDDTTLRFFCYWFGEDIDVDLSATFHDENFNYISHISYTNLKEKGAYHSGDLVTAPKGASEFLDIHIESQDTNCRYVVMNVLSYTNEKFKDIDDCFVGWMTRSDINTNEIFEPKTVKNKIDLVNETTYVCPVIFDLKERKAIFIDMTKHVNQQNNVESNMAGIEDILYVAVNQKKMSLFDLFMIHGYTRSHEIVSNKNDADFIFDLEEGDITPTDWLEIQTNWM